jgi:asparagine synthase (glutamine-hydrolysing)
MTRELETSRHLFQPPIYRAARPGAGWHRRFDDAVLDLKGKASWDVAAILSILSFDYACGDRTLLKEIKRRPWLSDVSRGEPRLEPLPPHGRAAHTAARIARDLYTLLRREVEEACRDRQTIYVLLSGGLDSRVGASALAASWREGKLPARPVGVTWGRESSRDVVYGRETARILGFEWQHAELSAENVIRNTELISPLAAAMVSPVHLHAMQWFRQAPPDAIVLAATYGDQLGRGEFNGKSLLERKPLTPRNPFGLLRTDILGAASSGLARDLEEMRMRSGPQPEYVLREHEMQGHYLRGSLAHAMNSINNFCTVYQLFTHPDVYSYMWSLHPSLRNDDVYAAFLEQVDDNLARLPWSRTNHALHGRTRGARPNLVPNSHDYPRWLREDLHERFRALVDPEWFAATGIFRPEGILRLEQAVREGGRETGAYTYGFHPYVKWAWLGGLRTLGMHLDKQALRPQLDPDALGQQQDARYPVAEGGTSHWRRLVGRSPTACRLLGRVRDHVRRIRKSQSLRRGLREFPPEPVVTEGRANEC